MRRRGIELRANAHPFSFPRGDARRLACSLATFVVAGHSAVAPMAAVPALVLGALAAARPPLPHGATRAAVRSLDRRRRALTQGYP